MRSYQVLLAATIPLAIAAMVVSQLFLLETLKVQLDFLWLATSLSGLIYILIIGASMLGQDISGHISYMFLTRMPRNSYLLGRTLGIVTGLLILLLCMMAIASLSLFWSTSQLTTIPPHSPVWWSPALLSGVTLIHSCTLLSMVIFTAAWASGFVEMLIFSTAFAALTYLLPPVISAMTTTAVLSQIPGWLATLIHCIDYLFPDMSGGEIALSLAHNIPLDASEIGWFIMAQAGYTIMIFAAGSLLFTRRDL